MDSIDMSLSKVSGIVKDREAWGAAAIRSQDLATKQQSLVRTRCLHCQDPGSIHSDPRSYQKMHGAAPPKKVIGKTDARNPSSEKW